MASRVLSTSPGTAGHRTPGIHPPDRSGVDLPGFSPRLLGLFRLYLRRHARRHFTAVRVSRGGPPPASLERPLLIVSNHPSWWDPLLFMLAGPALLPGREGYGPMDAGQLARYPFFRRLGVFGIEGGTVAGARAFLNVGRAVLARPHAALWVTAQGRFSDPRVRPTRLRPGVARLLRSACEVAVVPLAIEYPFWNHRLPEALLRFGPPLLVDDGRRCRTQEWRRLMEQALQRTQDALAAESVARDPSAFVDLVSGHGGTGGVYDLWRRWRERGAR